MFKNLTTSVALGWLGRRVLDWGGWLGVIVGGLFAFYAQMTPAQQQTIEKLFTGNWQDVTLGAIGPLIVLVFSQVMSFRATVKPQIVTEDGQKASTDNLPSAKKTMVEAVAETAIAKKEANPGPFGGFLKKLIGKGT